MGKRWGRRLLTLLAAAFVPVVMAPGTAHAVSGTVIVRLYNTGANWVNYSSTPKYDSAKANAIGDRSCDARRYTVSVNVYVVKLEPGRAKIRTVQLVMNNPPIDYFMYNAETAYFPASGGGRVSGPGLRSEVFWSGENTVYVIPYGDRWIALDQNRKWLEVKWTMSNETDLGDIWCNVVVEAKYYRGTPSSGGNSCSLTQTIVPVDETADSLPNVDETVAPVTDPVTMLVTSEVDEAIGTSPVEVPQPDVGAMLEPQVLLRPCQ